MKLDYDKLTETGKNINSVKTVVFYSHGGEKNSWSKYIPNGEIREEVKSDCHSSDILYYGSSKQFPSLDFPEYNFSYLIEKYKFSGDLKLLDISESLKELVGKDSIDLDKLENVLYPTVIEEDKSSSYSYFGSLNIQGQCIYLIKVPEWVDKIELYDEVIETNNSEGGFIDYSILDNSTNHPYSIKFGPERTDKRNLTSNLPMYYEFDDTSDVVEKFDTDYDKLLDEVSCSKIVLVLFSSDGNLQTINVSYSSWLVDKNPERNKYKYTLRNDEYYSTKNNLSNITKTGNIYFDSASGTMLGCKENTKTTLLDRKKSKLNNNYSPYVNYKRGSKVIKDKVSYISIVDNNTGQFPGISWKWVLEDSFKNNISSNKVDIFIEPDESASVSPNRAILVNDGEKVDFIYDLKAPYEFTSIKLDDGTYLELNSDYRVTYEKLIDDTWRTTITVGYGVGTWTRVLESGGTITFTQQKIPTTINLLMKRGDSEVLNKYPFDEPKIKLVKVISEGVELKEGEDWTLEGNILTSDKLFNKSEVQYVFENLSVETDIDKISESYRILGKDYTKELKFDENDYGDKTIITITDNDIQFSTSNLVMSLGISDIIINIIQNYGVEFNLSGYNSFTRDKGLVEGDLMFYLRDDHEIKNPTLLIETMDENKYLLELGTGTSLVVKDMTFTISKNSDIYNVLVDKLTENIKITVIEKPI